MSVCLLQRDTNFGQELFQRSFDVICAVKGGGKMTQRLEDQVKLSFSLSVCLSDSLALSVSFFSVLSFLSE